MFTGIIQTIGIVRDYNATISTLTVEIPNSISNTPLEIGESISIDGVCLTIKHLEINTNSTLCEFQIGAQTKLVTVISSYVSETCVNLERASTIKTLFGGHIVQGHVDTTGTITGITNSIDSPSIEFSFKPNKVDISPFIVVSGSIAIQGISLTIIRYYNGEIVCSIIPHTFSCTTLQYLKIGSLVNIEVDYIGKIILKHVNLYLENKKNEHISI
ncbi:MAG: riboflavin synthase [Methylacidiphilales bacterium]|nr:riboflavin synthase [Candidatus Methylacidiphilales bacterium]